MPKLFIAAAIAWLSALQCAGAAELRTVRYGIGQAQGASGGSQEQTGLGALPYVVAQRKGFFEHEGIRLDFVHVTQRPPLSNQQTLFESLGKGEFDMTRSQLSFLILEVLKGADFAAVAGNTENQLWSLMARPEIKSFADLKGKGVALTLPFDLITLSMLKVMERNGVGKNDVRISALVSSPARAQCMQAGECVAAALNEPFDGELEAKGFHRLGSTYDNPPIPFIVEVVNKTWAQAHADTVAGYIRGFASAMRFINDPQNADEIRPIIRELTRGSDDDARTWLGKYYYNAGHPYLPRQAELDVDGIGRVLALMAEFDQIPKPAPPTSRFIDLRYRQAAGVQ